jgi:hypothetical protein
MGVLVEWAAPETEAAWTHARVFKGTSKDTDLMTQVGSDQAITDTTYYDKDGTNANYYAVRFWDSVNSILSDFSDIIKAADASPKYSTIQLVRNQMKVTDTTVLADSVIEKFILFAEAEVDKKTGRTWKAPVLFSEYFDGEEFRSTTRSPVYETADTAEYRTDYLNLDNYPVTDIDGVWFVRKMQTADYVFSDDGGAFTDNSAEAATKTGTPFYAFAATPATNDALYIGNSVRFMGVNIRLSTLGDAGVVVWEYYNGSTWSTLTAVNDNIQNFSRSGKLTFALPLDWQTHASLNSVADQYWIRARITTAHSVSPKVQFINILDEIETEIEPQDVETDNVGTLTFLNDVVIDGTQNIRVDYYAGSDTVPVLVQDLATVLACIRGFIAISGGSYDDMSTYSLGELNVSLGEPYVNIREAITQLEKRRESLLDDLGRRIGLVSS